MISDSQLLAIADTYGTPIYVYDADHIRKQYEALIQSFDYPHVEIYYACKALSNPHILRWMKSLGCGVDAVSINEIKLAVMAGFEYDQIIYTPNMISIEDLEQAVEWGVRINIGSLRLLEFIGQYHPEYPIGLRINPHIMAGGHKKISTGHIDSKFGISIHQLPRAQRLAETMKLNICGLHMHNGSDILDSQVFGQAADILFDSARPFQSTLQYLDFGSGFKVSYRQGDVITDIQSFGQMMTTRAYAYAQEIGREISICFEPGKYLVSECGTFLCQVNQVKETTSTVFLGVNSGFHHLIRPMFYDAYHDIRNVSSQSPHSRVYTVVGQICETDTFGINRMMRESKVGDLIAIQNAGAYCYEMSSNYNAHLRPAEVLVHQGQSRLIRRRETFDDLIDTIV